MAAKHEAVAGQWVPETCSRYDMALLLGISIRTIADLAAVGVLKPAAQRGWYLTLPSLHAYLEKVRNQAAGRGGALSLNDERAKREAIDRQIAELKLAQARGEVLTLVEVSDAWTSFARSMKAAALALPAKFRASVPHLTAHDQETARQLIVDMLSALAEEVDVGVVGAEASELIEDGD